MRFRKGQGSTLLWVALLSLSVGHGRAQNAPLTITVPQVFQTGNGNAWVLFSTSAPAKASIDYNSTSGPTQMSAETGFDTSHALLLMGIVPGLIYQGTITVTDPNGQTSTVALAPFQATEVQQDMPEPVQPEALVISQNEVVIAFTTAAPTSAIVNYGTAGMLNQMAFDPVPSMSHAISLIGLTPGGTYSFIVSATGLDGSVSSSATQTFVVTALQRDFGPGDVNGDGAVTVTDAAMALRYVVGTLPLAPEQVQAADVIPNGVVNIADCIRILTIALLGTG